MRLAATRQVEGYIQALSAFEGGTLVLSWATGGRRLQHFDPALGLRWSVPLDAGAGGLLVDEHLIWVLDGAGARAFDGRGEPCVRVERPRREGLHLTDFCRADEDLLFLWDHGRGPLRPPVLERVTRAGAVRWSTALPIAPLEHEGVIELPARTGERPRGKAAWRPETWLACVDALTVSGDAVLACLSEMPRSGIGSGQAVGLGDGALRFTTRRGPVGEVAAASVGAFLVGFQGYGAFETLLYGRDGRVEARWASHGYVEPGAAGHRVVEMENRLPSRMRLARLLPGGTVEHGDRLEGYATTPPRFAPDGTAYFHRGGAFWAARGLHLVDRLALEAPGDPITSRVVVSGSGLCFGASSPRLGAASHLYQVELDG